MYVRILSHGIPAPTLCPRHVFAESGSDLASIVYIPEYLEKWPQLPSNHPLAQLYTKFWGKSMADEERDWRISQSIGVNSGDGGDEGEGMDDAKINDINPGCYVLNIDIDAIPYPRIWIRAEYMRMYDFFEHYYLKISKQMRGPSPSAVLTGQPGIGKCLDPLCLTPTPC